MTSDPLAPLLDALRGARGGTEREFQLATVTQVSPLRLQFDGEDTASTRTYTRLSTYTVTLNDRVLCGRIGTTWTVLGKVV